MRLLLSRFELVGKEHSPCGSHSRKTSIAAQQNRLPLGHARQQPSVSGARCPEPLRVAPPDNNAVSASTHYVRSGGARRLCAAPLTAERYRAALGAGGRNLAQVYQYWYTVV